MNIAVSLKEYSSSILRYTIEESSVTDENVHIENQVYKASLSLIFERAHNLFRDLSSFEYGIF